MDTTIKARKLSQDFIHLLLIKLGNASPNRQQVQLAKMLFFKASINHHLISHHSLSEREVSCLLLAAKGCTMGEVAKLLQVKPTTVATWHKKIKRKLVCRSIAQAVFEGICYGYVQPSINRYESK